MTSTAQNAGTHRHAQKITPIRPTGPESDGLGTEFTERAYIAALIRDPDARKIITEGITVDHFTRPECADAFTAITLLLADGITPDAATIATLTDNATMIEVETSLRENVSAANRASYVTVLKDYRIKRQLQEMRSKLTTAANAGQSPAELRAIVEQMDALQSPVSGNKRFTPISAMNHPADIDWLIEGYLERDTTIQIFGDPGSGKSFVALDMALSIANGLDWHGQKTSAGPVFYLAGEGQRGLQRRIEAWHQQHGISDRTAPFFVSNGGCAVSHPDEQAALIHDIDEALKAAGETAPALIVVDTLARHFGGGDENSTKDMGTFIARLDALRQRYRCGILLVHHTGHADKSRARGSIALLGSLDAEYRVEKIGDATISLTSTRQKDNDNPPTLSWTLTRYDLPWADAKGRLLNSAVLVPNDSAPAAKPIKEKMGHQQRRAMELLEELYRKQRQNLEDAGHDPNVARVTLEDWHNAMVGISTDSSNRSKLRKTLAERGYVRIEECFAYLNSDGTDTVRGKAVVNGKNTAYYRSTAGGKGGSVS